MRAGVSWLISRQGNDGGWHSETYGALRDGAATTALVLYAMSHLPDDQRGRHRERLQRGYAFLQKGIRKKGYVCAPDGTADYPTYGSAMTLVAAPRLGLSVPKNDAERLIEYLLEAQLTESRGFRPGDPNYGGWDMLGGTGPRGQTSGTNVSVSSFSLEALGQSTHKDAKQAIERAAAWIDGCQNLAGDGGFVFHPEPDHEGNKALWQDDDRRPRSYGTATCDGLRCLFLTGAARNDRRVRAAVDWLVKHPDVNAVPGFEKAPAHARTWKEGLRYYYMFGLSLVLPYLPETEAARRRTALGAAIVGDQRDDGSWKNTSARMREDDSLIATCLALIGLARTAKDVSREGK